MRDLLIKEIREKILNIDLLDQFDNSCNFNNINYLAIIDALDSIKTGIYTDQSISFDDIKTLYPSIIGDFLDKITKLENFRYNECEQVQSFLLMEKEMKEKIKDQIIQLAKKNILSQILPNLGNRLNANNISDEVDSFLNTAFEYVQKNYNTFISVNNFVFNGLSQIELTLIDSI